MVILAACTCQQVCYSQGQEAKQLMLNWEKLTELKKVLQNMYKSYEVLKAGYVRIRDISSGSLNLHTAFLNGLLEVSPAVKDYYKVGEILMKSRLILSETKKARSSLAKFTVHPPGVDIQFRRRLDAMANPIAKRLEELLAVIVDSELRMDDGERLKIIDRIYDDVNRQLVFVRQTHREIIQYRILVQRESADLIESGRVLGF